MVAILKENVTADCCEDLSLNSLVVGRHLYAEFAHPDHRAGLLALLSASLGLTLVGGDNGYPGQLVLFLLRSVVPLGRHPDVDP